jgi:hypothetical protein
MLRIARSEFNVVELDLTLNLGILEARNKSRNLVRTIFRFRSQKLNSGLGIGKKTRL